MMKQFKKLTLAVVTFFMLLLTVASGTISSLPLPSITVEENGDTEPTPVPEIAPLADDDDDKNSYKSK